MKIDCRRIEFYVCNCVELNVRQTPNTEHPPIRRLKLGTKVNIFEISGTWARIHRDRSEWVNMKYIAQPTLYYYHADAPWAIQEAVLFTSPVIGNLEKNSFFYGIPTTTDHWVKLAGRRGYVYTNGQFVSL